MATMKITAFEVKRCGYYRRGKPVPEFGGLEDILADIKAWAALKAMAETKTFEPAEDDVLPVYCFDISKADDGCYLLTTWNEVPMAEEGVPIASGTAKVGQVNVEIAKVDEGDIPGFPTYFYFMPGQSLVFSVRPEWQKHSGHQGLLKFMRGYIEKASSYRVLDPDAEDADNKIVGYRNDPTGKVRKLIPSYYSMLKRLPGQVDYLISNRDRIRKIVRCDTLQLSFQEDRHLVGKLLENVGILDRQITQQSMSFKYELDFQPTAEELEKVIGAEEAPATRPGRLGFMLTGSQEVYWLDHAFAKDDIELKVTVGDNGVLSSSELIKELGKYQHRLLDIAKVTIQETETPDITLSEDTKEQADV